MLGLLERSIIEGVEASFVSDDQVLISVKDSLLLAEAPETIAGKVEISGFGVIDYPYVSHCRITHVARIIDDKDIERMPDKETTELLGGAKTSRTTRGQDHFCIFRSLVRRKLILPCQCTKKPEHYLRCKQQGEFAQ